MIDVNTVSAKEHFTTLSNQVYLALRKQIISGTFAPNSRLVRRRISKDFGVSPIPVTEALWRLEQDGLVESEPMYGARVKALTLEDVRNEQILREALECQAARLCAEHASSSQIQDLFEKAEPLDRLMQSPDQHSQEGMKQHLEFHLTIARYSGCALLEKELQRVGYQGLMRISWVNAGINPVPPNWHQQLVRVLAGRDPDRAEVKMRKHVRYGKEHFREALQKALMRSQPALTPVQEALQDKRLHPKR